MRSSLPDDYNRGFDRFFLKDRPPHPASSTREYAVFRMRILQELKTNPELYWAFDFASRGQKGWDFYVRSKRNNTLRRDIVRLMPGSLKVGVGVGPISLGVDLPAFSDDLDETLKEDLINKWAFGYDQTPYLPEIATLVTDISFDACEGGGLHCEEFQDKFPFVNAGVWSAALTTAKRTSQSWPESKKWEDLEMEFPQEASFVRTIKVEKNTEKLLNMMAETTVIQSSGEEQRVAHIPLNTEPVSEQEEEEDSVSEQEEEDFVFDQEGDSVISKLRKSKRDLEGRLKKVNEKIINAGQKLKPSEMETLLKDRASLEKGIEDNKKAQKLHKHNKDCIKAEAWIGAATSTARLLNAPPLVVKIGVAAGVGTKMFKAGKSMLITGALDPTGLTTIANGAEALISLIFSVPSTEQVMLEKLDEILENQQKILSNQKKLLAGQKQILTRIDRMQEKLLSRFNDLENILSKNHEEILAGQHEIQNSLKNLHTDMIAGFESIRYKMDETTYKNAIIKAQSLRAQYYNNPDSLLYKALSLCQQDEQYCKSNDLASSEYPDVKEHLNNMMGQSNNLSQTYSFTSGNFFNLSEQTPSSGEANYTKDDHYRQNAYINKNTPNGEIKEKMQEEMRAIQNLLNSPLQSRIPYLYSMLLWLDDQWSATSKQNNDNMDMLWRHRQTELSNNWSDSIKIKEIMDFLPYVRPAWHLLHRVETAKNLKNQSIGQPALQDELFFEAANLSMVLPEKSTTLEDYKIDNGDTKPMLQRELIHKLTYQQIAPICENSQAIEGIAEFMRSILPLVWKIYVINQFSTSEALYSIGSRQIKSFSRQFKFQRDEEKTLSLANIKPEPYFTTPVFTGSPGNYQAHGENRCDKRYSSMEDVLMDGGARQLGRKVTGPMFNHIKVVKSETSRFRNDMYLKISNPSILLRSPVGLMKYYTAYINTFLISALEKSYNLAIVMGYFKTVRVQDTHYYDHECYREPAAPTSCYTVCRERYKPIKRLVLIPDTQRFVKTQTSTWLSSWRKFYKNILMEWQPWNIDLMKAYLVLDTVIKIGYGEMLNSHPDLAFLRKLMQRLSFSFESDKIYTLAGQLSDQDWDSIKQFFKQREVPKDILSYYTQIAEGTGTNVEDWLDRSFWPECDTKKDRTLHLISHIQGEITELQSKNKILKEKWTEFEVGRPAKMIENDIQIQRWKNTLRQILNEGDDAVRWDENELTALNIHYKWPRPLCEDINYNMDSVRLDTQIYPWNLLPRLPIPPEETWKGQPVGWGRPDLRQKAFEKISLYDHIQLKGCGNAEQE